MVYTDAANNSTTLVSDYFVMFAGLAPEQTYATEQGCLAADPKTFQGKMGDPVNPYTGNFTDQFVDLSIPARGFPLSFERSYNSLDATNMTTLGSGWTHNYNMRLTFSTQYSVTIASFIGARGSYLEFAANPNGTFSPKPGVRGQLVQNGNGTYTLSDIRQNRYSFDSTGRLTQMADANGNSQTFTYNGSQLVSVSDASGRSLQFGYDGSGRINQISDTLGRTVRFGYDANGNLTNVTDTRGFVTTMTYDANHHLLTIVDPNNHAQVTNHYDAQSRIDYQLDALNQQTSFAYSAGVTQTVVTDPRGYHTTYNYSNDRLLTSVVDALGHGESYAYDSNLNRISVTDRNGHQTQFTWNTSGCNLASVTDALNNKASFYYDGNNNLTSSYDPLQRPTQYTYDAHNNLQSIVKPISGTIAFGYDALGQQTSRTDENNHATNYGYDQYGNRTTITDTLTHVTNMAYDLGGRLTDLTDALGHRTHYLYDAANHVTQVVLNYDPTRAQNDGNQYNLTTQYGYDPAGNLTFITNTLGLVTKTDYDTANRPLKVTVNYVLGGPSDSQTNLTTTYSYDPNGNRQSVTDAKNQTTQFGYNELNRLSSTTDPLNHTTQYRYDWVGNLTQVLDANNNSTQFSYDAVNRPITITNGLGYKTQYGYDAIGNRTLITDALRIMIGFGYDGLNRLTTVTENYQPGLGSTVSQNVTTTYGYDNVGNLAQVLDANGHSTFYSYDELNRLKTTQDALGHTNTNSYDAVGKLQSRLDANNATTTYVYDGVDRLVQINYPTSSVTFAYDPLGHRKTMLDSAGVSQYSYDAVYRLNTVTDPFTQTVGYSYDRVGNRVGLSYPNGKQVAYGYDAANRLQSVTDWNTQTTQYAYDNADRLTGATLPNGVSVGYAYDKANQLRTIEYDRGTTLLGRVDYTVDAVGNRIEQDESIHAVESSVGASAPMLSPMTATPIATLSKTATPTPKPSATATPTVAPSGTATSTAMPSSTATATRTNTPAQTATATATTAPKATNTPSATATLTKTSPATPSSSPTPSTTAQGTATATPTRTATSVHALNSLGSSMVYVAFWADSSASNSQANAPVGAPASQTPTATRTLTRTPTRAAIGSPTTASNMSVNAPATKPPTLTRTPTNTATFTPTPLPSGADTTVIKYTYDPLYRLTQAKYSTYGGAPLAPILMGPLAPGNPTKTPTPTPIPPLGVAKTITYTYDAVGNRLTQNNNGTVTNYGYDIANRLTNVNGQSYTWDNNGNLLSEGTRTFTYDTANRLTQVVNGSTTAQMAYNGLGDRLQQTVNGVQTRYALDSASGLTQVLADGTNTYLYGVGRLAQQQTNMQYFGVDGLGSVRQLYNSTGQIIANHRYDPFGNTISQSGVGSSAYGFTGEQQDATGLDYLRARYYDPVTGRFLSQDAWGGNLRNPESQNGWSYAEDNPALLTDPSGMCTSGIGFDKIWSGLNSDLFNGGWDQIQAGLNENWQECQQNWNKAQAAWQKGDYGRAVTWGTGFTSGMQRAAQWVSDNNRDWDILRDSGCNEATREAAGKRIFGRGFNLAEWIVPAGIGAKSVFSKATLAEGVLTEAEEEALASKQLVIGENMKERVIPYARRIGAEVYPGMFGYTDDLATEALLDDQLYIQRKMAEGYRIIDIGPDFARRVKSGLRSADYEMERRVTNGYALYEKRFIRKGKNSSILPEP